jgi:hypothetical protein
MSDQTEPLLPKAILDGVQRGLGVWNAAHGSLPAKEDLEGSDPARQV